MNASGDDGDAIVLTRTLSIKDRKKALEAAGVSDRPKSSKFGGGTAQAPAAVRPRPGPPEGGASSHADVGAEVARALAATAAVTEAVDRVAAMEAEAAEKAATAAAAVTEPLGDSADGEPTAAQQGEAPADPRRPPQAPADPPSTPGPAASASGPAAAAPSDAAAAAPSAAAAAAPSGATPRRLVSKSKPFWERELERQEQQQQQGGGAKEPPEEGTPSGHRRTTSAPLTESPHPAPEAAPFVGATLPRGFGASAPAGAPADSRSLYYRREEPPRRSGKREESPRRQKGREESPRRSRVPGLSRLLSAPKGESGAARLQESELTASQA